MSDADEPSDTGATAEALDQLANTCTALVAAWHVFGAAHAAAPSDTSRVSTEVRQFERFNGPTPKNVGHAPGYFAGLYVDAIAQHVEALEALLRTRRLTVAPWPIVRAALEIAGRVAWLLEPGLGERSGERRVARFYLESISSLQRDRYTVGKYDRGQAKRIKRARDAQIAEATAVYDDLDLDLSEIENIETWTVHGESYIGLGAAVQRFSDMCFSEASGLYDHLSDYSHPSLLATTRQTTAIESDGVIRRPWTVDVSTIEHQCRLICLILYKTAHLIADYYDSDVAVLDRWADVAPPAWFTSTA